MMFKIPYRLQLKQVSLEITPVSGTTLDNVNNKKESRGTCACQIRKQKSTSFCTLGIAEIGLVNMSRKDRILDGGHVINPSVTVCANFTNDLINNQLLKYKLLFAFIYICLIV